MREALEYCAQELNENRGVRCKIVWIRISYWHVCETPLIIPTCIEIACRARQMRLYDCFAERSFRIQAVSKTSSMFNDTTRSIFFLIIIRFHEELYSIEVSNYITRAATYWRLPLGRLAMKLYLFSDKMYGNAGYGNMSVYHFLTVRWIVVLAFN